MTPVAPTATPLRIRIFVDFWNFSLALRQIDSTFMLDWKPVPSVFVAEAAQLLGAPVIFEAMHVYGSYDPAKPNDVKFKNWFSNWLDKQPGTHTVLLERQKKRNPPSCPHCYNKVETCPTCSGDMRGTEEKGVDTRIATDLISLAWSNGYDVAVIVSADRDFVPVADFLQSRGIKVIHAAFPPSGSQLSQRCWANFSVTSLMPKFKK
ncbi:NYN domain-containing protein (plasmid) [Pararoseomonas sp. SCSIO 73927]|uniref:NYN domain-containing protein n=1 Tax=Pararoseomonas sp. SCSIO 73927 TaxID=3114537 RepID=UPI0030D07D9C